ncbi:histidine triad nucleotide-binding protein 2, mitochondrial-like [Bombyx mandarina]|uniref:Uncharacterized protein n=2 Tax=Bombyx TaxID=7090 RepID=A0A8R2HT88_BOMMO|nr:histidine triad nucleotide-binding protein 2, mitochondrial [Bombyx mori]XP_028028844.1 histidine triad nucleotide-binding protein 2, mitochondrial-like [Bombyx mandarina]
MAAQTLHSKMEISDIRKSKQVLYEDNQCVVFDEELDRQAPIHFLVVPKKVIPVMSEASVDDEKIIGHLLLVANEVATKKGLYRQGYHVFLDENHKIMKLKALHVFGRALHHMVWPSGPGARL